jgi:TonB family protein
MKFYFLFSFLICASLGIASDNQIREGKDLIEKAAEKMNIFALPYFEMKANVRIANQGKPLEGSYLLLWNGPEQWREEINFPGYTETQLGGKGVVFLKRTTDFMPLRINQLHAALGYDTAGTYGSMIPLAPRSDETIKKVKDRKVNGTKVKCAEIADQEKHTREVCVDSATGTVVRQESLLDREVMPVGTKFFPRFLSYVQDGKPLAEVQVTELKTTQQFPSSAFAPPAGSLSRPGCMNPSPARLVHKVRPRYPEEERQSRAEGTVAVYALIGADGQPRDFRIVSGATPGLNAAGLEGVQQWLYKPATCNGTPVEVETVLTVNYSLR